VLDNLSAHKTKAVEQFLALHPKVRFHFTPIDSSWSNQVELGFAKIQREKRIRINEISGTALWWRSVDSTDFGSTLA
jgi:transposase